MKLRYTPKAAQSLETVFAYIARDDPEAAARTIRRIRRAIDRLAIFPESGRPGPQPSIRQLVVHRLPYIVFYKIHADAVVILGVYHGAQQHLKNKLGNS